MLISASSSLCFSRVLTACIIIQTVHSFAQRRSQKTIKNSFWVKWTQSIGDLSSIFLAASVIALPLSNDGQNSINTLKMELPYRLMPSFNVLNTQISPAIPQISICFTWCVWMRLSNRKAELSFWKTEYSSRSLLSPLCKISRMPPLWFKAESKQGSIEAPLVFWTQCTGHWPPFSLKEQWLSGCQSSVTAITLYFSLHART